MKKLLWMSALVVLSSPVFAYDPAYVAQHIRKALNLNTRIEIKVSPKPEGNIGDLLIVPVTINGGPYQIYLSKDEKEYIWGYSIDLMSDPDIVRASAINLKNVRSKGSDSAPVTIVEFSDFQCPHCKKAHQVIKEELYKNYTSDQVRLVFKHFPLSNHAWAEPAAAASECAGDQKGKAFWDLANFYFENSVQLSTANLTTQTMGFAQSLGLDTLKLKLCLSSEKPLAKVRTDKKEGSAAGVSSTPTLFVNGRMITGFRDFNDIKIVIDEKLAEATLNNKKPASK
jgi:protein-disulfide isomerase